MTITGEQPGTFDRNTRALSLLRIAVGALFLIFAEYKIVGTQFTLGGGFDGWIRRFLADGAAYPFMIPVLRGFVQEHSVAIAFLVAYGELAIGLALVLGVLVRTASVAGFIAGVALFVQLSRGGRRILAVFRSVVRPLGSGDVLCRFRDRQALRVLALFRPRPSRFRRHPGD